jgi:hypothetical protein
MNDIAQQLFMLGFAVEFGTVEDAGELLDDKIVWDMLVAIFKSHGGSKR